MVLPLPDLPAEARRAARRPAPEARGRPVVRALPARRPDGGRGRLPRHPPRGRGAAPSSRRERPRRDGSVVRAHGRVPRLGRDDRPRPAARSRPCGALRGRDVGGLPTRHVRPHRADATDPPSVRLRRRGRVARGAERRPAHGVLVVEPRRQQRARRVPADRVWQRRRAARRRQGPDRATERMDRVAAVAPRVRRSDPHHERLRPPRTSGIPRSRRRRGERAAGRARHRGHLVGELPRVRITRRTAQVAGRAALGSAGQPPHGSRLEPSRRAACRGGHRTVARAPRRAAERVAAPRRRVARAASRRSVARGHPQRGARLDLRVLGRRGLRRGAAPVRAGTSDRRRPHASRSAHPWQQPRALRARRDQPVGPRAKWPRDDHRRCRHRSRRPRAGASAARRGADALGDACCERGGRASRRDRVDHGAVPRGRRAP